MDLAGWLGIALTVLTIALVVAGLYAVRVLVVAIRTLLATTEELRSKVLPLLDKADITVDAVNAELLRIDAIVTQAEGVGDAVSTASDFIKSPVNTAAQGLARVIRAFGKRPATRADAARHGEDA